MQTEVKLAVHAVHAVHDAFPEDTTLDQGLTPELKPCKQGQDADRAGGQG